MDGASLNFVFDNIGGIDLLKYFKCFNNVSDAGASYSITLCADIPVNDNPDALLSSNFRPGHTFLILTKTNGSTSVSHSFGLYPQNGLLSVSSLAVGSKIVDDGFTLHEYNASISMNNISQGDFQAAQYMAENLANSSFYHSFVNH